MSEKPTSRYDRQARFAPLGAAGQEKLEAGHVLVCGCGALGSVIATTLVRAGVGFVRIVDRDFIELNNLQRQVLFDEQDVAEGLPKAIAAANKLAKINSAVRIEPIVADITHANISQLAGDVDVILDGMDNFATRFLINDYAVKHNRPWVYGGAIGAEGQSMTIVPGETACLACLMPEAPPPGATPTCDTAGILGPTVNVVASLQSCEAIKLLSGNRTAISRRLTIVDLWGNHVRQLDLARLRDEADCRVCKHREFAWLSGQRSDSSAVLCGRNAVQLSPAEGIGRDATRRGRISLEELASRLSGVGKLQKNPFLLRLSVDGYVLTVFADGRTIVSGTADIATARTLHARYIGA